MAYQAPELLLVGAARNMVLMGSMIKPDTACSERDTDPAGPIEYDVVSLW